jgi:hypothetical protein
MNNIKPPLGIMPKNIRKEHRVIDLVAAMGRQAAHYTMDDFDDVRKQEAIDQIVRMAEEIVGLNP